MRTKRACILKQMGPMCWSSNLSFKADGHGAPAVIVGSEPYQLSAHFWKSFQLTSHKTILPGTEDAFIGHIRQDGLRLYMSPPAARTRVYLFSCRFSNIRQKIWKLIALGMYLTDCLELLLDLFKVLALGSTKIVVGIFRLVNEIRWGSRADCEYCCCPLWPLCLTYSIHDFHLLLLWQINYIL